MQISSLVQQSHASETLLSDEGDRRQGKLLLFQSKQFLKIVVQLLHDDIRVLLQFLKSVDLREVPRPHEVQHNLEFFFDQYQSLYRGLSTLP